ncbi:MAG: hypothetical protein JNJ65_01635 [Cyclobacteriaceae bacterium]|nr:hypothetical protein [Cyclobacteriaceae bacterium]
MTKLVPDFVDETLIKSEADRQNMEAILTTTRVLRKIYKDRNVIEEVNAAIASDYYEDERVLLKDLLNPENSPIYQLPQFKERQLKRGFEVGIFKTSFERELGHQEKSGENFRTNEEFFDDSGVSIYFPYHEQTQYTNYIYAIVPATVEADQQVIPMPYGPEPDIINPPDHTMLVNDNYSEIYPTHIVGMGAETTLNQTQQNCANLKVSIGKIKVLNQKQYDSFISFNGNGGGSEFFFIGVKAQSTTTPITSWNNTAYHYVTRSAIRNGNWIDIWRTLDQNWQSNSINQLFGIYEYDNTSDKKYFTGTLRFNNGGITHHPYCNIEVTSKNGIINSRFFERTELTYQYNTFGNTPEFLNGFGPQYNSTDGNVLYSLPGSCY